MKKLILTIALTLTTLTHAGQCGMPPMPPFGMYYLCICDNMGNNCHWVLVSK